VGTKPQIPQITVLSHKYIYFAHPPWIPVSSAGLCLLFMDMPTFFSSPQLSLLTPSIIPLPDLHCSFIHHRLHLLDLLLQLHISATLLDNHHHHGPQPSPSPTRTFSQRTAAPLGLSLPPSPGPFYTIYTLSVPYIYPPILYISPPPPWTLSALPDPLFPPNPHRLSTFLYYIYPSILYILSPPSQTLTAFHPDPHHRLLPPPTSFPAPRTFFSF